MRLSLPTISLFTVITISFMLFSTPLLYAHTFSENENALFLTMIAKIKAETSLVAQDASNNTQQAQTHAKVAAALLTQNDPVVNTTWTSEISERNPRITADLLHSLNDLKTSIGSGSGSSSSSNSSSVQSKVNNIGNLLDEATAVRVSNNLVKNPKTQALVLANLGNEIYNNYGKALGIPQSTIASMGGMKMPGMNVNTAANSSGGSGSSGMSGMSMGSNKSSMNMGTGSKGGGAMSGMNSMNGQATAMNQNNPSIKNMTAYETAQSLATQAQQVFNKGLKPVAPTNATNANVQIGKDVDQRKNAISSKAPFMNVMELIHVKLHPTMISAYNLTLGK